MVKIQKKNGSVRDYILNYLAEREAINKNNTSTSKMAGTTLKKSKTVFISIMVPPRGTSIKKYGKKNQQSTINLLNNQQ